MAALAAVSLLFAAAGCGSDKDDAKGSTGSTTTEESAGGTAVKATLTDAAIEGVPEELEAGLVDVTVTDKTKDGGAGGDINFSLVAEGTTEAQFKEDIAKVFEGQAFPKSFLNTAGADGESTIILAEGDYVVWMDKASELDRESTADDLITTTMTVTAGDADATLPAADGTITVTDYEFDIDVPAGKSTVNFINESTEQFHHVLLTDFGTNDPELVKEKLPEILQSEGETMPEGIDPKQVNDDVPGSSVFGPGSSGSFKTELVAGHTYVALCFLSDVAGGAPHAMQHEMVKVFTVS